jgi:hypothetical protein
LITSSPTDAQEVNWSSSHSYVFTLSTLQESHFDRSTANGRVIHAAFKGAVAHIANVSSNEITIQVSSFIESQPSERRTNAGCAQVEIQIARAPPPEFASRMVAPEEFAKYFVALAQAQGVTIEHPKLQRLHVGPELETESDVSGSLAWPLFGSAFGLLTIAAAVAGYLYFQKQRQVAMEDQNQDQGTPRAISIVQCVDDGLTSEDVDVYTNPLKEPNLVPVVDEVQAVATRSGADASDHKALAELTTASPQAMVAATSESDAAVEQQTTDGCISI